MVLEIRQEDKLWVIDIEEKFAFKTYEDMKSALDKLMSAKREHGQYKQLKREAKETECNNNKNEMKKRIKEQFETIQKVFGNMEDDKNG